MAWLKPFFAFIPQLNPFTSRRDPISHEEHHVDEDYTSTAPASNALSPSGPASNAINAISMYQRVITLQPFVDYTQSPLVSHSHHTTRAHAHSGRRRYKRRHYHHFDSPSPSIEPMLSPRNNPSEFDSDDDDGDDDALYDSDDSLFSTFSLTSNLASSNASVLSDEEYVELHSRMSVDELRRRLYEDNATVETDMPSWMHIERDEQQPHVHRITVNNEKGKLNEHDWQQLSSVIEEHGLVSQNIALELRNIVLDATASQYLHTLLSSSSRDSRSPQLVALCIENAYFENSKSRHEDFYMFTQTEGSVEGDHNVDDDDDDNNDDDDDTQTEGSVEGDHNVDDDDNNDNDDDDDAHQYFDFVRFCESILQNDGVCELSITHTNLHELLSDGTQRKQLFMNVLSQHRGLNRIDLSSNALHDADMFVDALLSRKVPLEKLDLSFNPMTSDDVEAIEWAASKRYVSDFEFDVNFGSALFNAPAYKAAVHAGAAGNLGMEPIDAIHRQYDAYNDEAQAALSAEDDGDVDDDDDDELFMSSLFPISNVMQDRNNAISLHRRMQAAEEEEEDKKTELCTDLHPIELGIQIVRKKSASKPKKKKLMCHKFVFLSEGSQEAHQWLHLHNRHADICAPNSALSNHPGQVEPGTMQNHGECANTSEENEHLLMLRI
eukprot:CAMPEP_0202729214 /NCGR_PEP_ID=MMETSP1385-20130828/186019_1 /ASSEMBLY_ACC=CAM_ASM_000861 /TAXON_ID=933848 /ORGANISM="Elphidium margaritaceum" /LENGTH=663 /DNA_ID=CAMNT_0049395471 /DNA_START=42 /DNA_END=2033 /DNA_ORIENTATION=-